MFFGRHDFDPEGAFLMNVQSILFALIVLALLLRLT